MKFAARRRNTTDFNQPSRNGILICPGCNGPIIGGSSVWYHSRLNCYVHGRLQCMKNVYGEDVTYHAMTPMNISY